MLVHLPGGTQLLAPMADAESLRLVIEIMRAASAHARRMPST
jgi:hypothetical protein